MSKEVNSDKAIRIDRIVSLLFGSPWLEIIAEAWKISRKLWLGLANEGIYEVLEYNLTYELKDSKGKKAHFHKQEKVHYVQDNIVSYRDQAWGEGEILQNYRCSPGVKADEYKLGHKTMILISLREMKQRGEVDEFNIEWDMFNTFLNANEYCEAEISHRTKQFSMQVIFPKSRPPLKASIFENTRRKSRPLSEEEIQKLPDGRWRIRWETERPRLYERYILKWDW